RLGGAALAGAGSRCRSCAALARRSSFTPKLNEDSGSFQLLSSFAIVFPLQIKPMRQSFLRLFDAAVGYMFPNCDSGKSAKSQNCDAAQVDEDIRRPRCDLIGRERRRGPSAHA